MDGSRIKYSALLLLGFFTFPSFSQSVGGITSGATSGCGSAAGFLSLTGTPDTAQYWEASTNGGATWTNVGYSGPPNQYSYNVTQTTCYRAVVKKYGFPSDTSTVSCVTIYQPTVGGTLSTGGNFCSSTGPGSITLSGNTGNVLNWLSSADGGVTWTVISNTTTVLTYTNISVNTIFEAVVQNSSFCAIDSSAQSIFTIDPVSAVGTMSLGGNDTVCYALNSGTITVNTYTSTVTGWLSSTNGGASWTAISNTTASQTFSGLLQNTLYEVIVQSGVCPPDTSGAVGITVVPLPVVNAGFDTTIQPGQSVTLNGSGNGAPFWMPGATLSSTTIFSPVATPTATTAYILIVSNSLGCVNADTVLVTVSQPTFTGTVTNFFTPNNDGVNDTWYIQNIKNYPGNEVFVYNIYGQLVYNQKDYQNDWKGTYNGSDLSDGTYYYVLRITKPDTTEKGSIDIIRKK